MVSATTFTVIGGGVLWFCLTEMFCETFGWKPDFASM